MEILAAPKRHSIPSFVAMHTVDFSVSSAEALLGLFLGKELCENAGTLLSK
jgi:hypothetical protein